MATTAAAISPDPGLRSVGDVRSVVIDLTLSGSYPTGGEPITIAQLGAFGLTRCRWGTASVKTPSAAAVASAAVLPQSDGTVLVKCNTTTAEVGAGVNTGAVVLRVVLYGDG